jgi:hypothetical protein
MTTETYSGPLPYFDTPDFDGRLWDRYPIIDSDGDDVWILRPALTAAERAVVVQRLRSEAANLSDHADALEAEGGDAAGPPADVQPQE